MLGPLHGPVFLKLKSDGDGDSILSLCFVSRVRVTIVVEKRIVVRVLAKVRRFVLNLHLNPIPEPFRILSLANPPPLGCDRFFQTD